VCCAKLCGIYEPTANITYKMMDDFIANFVS